MLAAGTTFKVKKTDAAIIRSAVVSSIQLGFRIPCQKLHKTLIIYY